jgi:hypothetical protein
VAAGQAFLPALSGRTDCEPVVTQHATEKWIIDLGSIAFRHRLLYIVRTGRCDTTDPALTSNRDGTSTMATKNIGKRQELQKRDGTRFRCRAVVERFSTKAAFRGPPVPTILLGDIVDADIGTLLTDHLWFTTGKWSAGLAAGHMFEFEARAADYIKGHQGRREEVYAPVSRDWKLQRPTKVAIFSRESVAAA